MLTDEEIELSVLLKAVYLKYGYDFREYSYDSLLRRVRLRCKRWQCESISSLIPLVIYSEDKFRQLLHDLTIPVTSMFRDPEYFKALVDNVFPVLKTYPKINIWHAGCASGEEVYSLVFLLNDYGLYDRASIYATDINQQQLDQARRGRLDVSAEDAKQAYHRAGGISTLERYVQVIDRGVEVLQPFTENIYFCKHDLTTDNHFGQMELIICRNVLIYFDQELKKNVINLFSNALYEGGFLFLGKDDALVMPEFENNFSSFDGKFRIYKRSF
ncbi:CheR family methyltransferase [Marinobacterium jannaschii]|uniref:CheR family methyltransferase n=1 Tax=Marinobacterium jannaschii TaxID=64970 RepID=UPI00055EA323|nr:CheR family methyltransferase [Marinobacterium jannaschii]